MGDENYPTSDRKLKRPVIKETMICQNLPNRLPCVTRIKFSPEIGGGGGRFNPDFRAILPPIKPVDTAIGAETGNGHSRAGMPRTKPTILAFGSELR